MSKGHKHAELMLEFAKDMAEDSLAFKNWQLKSSLWSDEWSVLNAIPMWDDSYQYRRKPEGPKEYVLILQSEDGTYSLCEGKNAPLKLYRAEGDTVQPLMSLSEAQTAQSELQAMYTHCTYTIFKLLGENK